MTTASIATSLVACFIQLICLMSRPLRTMLRVTKHLKNNCVLLFGMNRLKHRKENNKCENFLLVWEFCGEPGEVWEFKKNVRFSNWCWNSYASRFAGVYIPSDLYIPISDSHCGPRRLAAGLNGAATFANQAAVSWGGMIWGLITTLR